MNITARIFTNRSESFASGALILAFFGFLSRIAGLVRDRVLASRFGAGDVLDAYYAAFKVPDLIFNVLIIGAISASFIPIFSYYLNISKEEADDFLNAIFSAVMVSLIAVSGIFIIFAPHIVRIIVPGFGPDKLKTTILLTRIMFLSPIFLGLSAIFGSVLQTLKHFLIFSIAPIFYNLGIIFGAVFLTKYFSIVGLALGVIIGALLHLSIQIPGVYFFGFRPRFIFNFWHSGILKMFKLTLPRILGLATSQINEWIIAGIASTFAAGSLAIFNLAYNLEYVPVGLLGVSFALAVFPMLSENFVKKEKDKFILNVSSAFRQILFYVIPFSVMFIVLRAQIIRIILGAGKFDWEATRLTAAALALFSLSVFAQSLIALLARAFYALENTRIPTVISIISVFTNFALSITSVFLFNHFPVVRNAFAFVLRVGDLPDIRILALPMAFSIANTINFALLFVFLKRLLGKVDGKRIIISFLKIFFSSVAAGFVAYLFLNLTANFVNMKTFAGVFAQAAISSIFALAVFSVFCVIFSCDEFFIFKNAVVLRASKIKSILNKLILTENIEQ